MSKYLFETDKAGFYEHGIDFLRNGYAYVHVEYNEVFEAKYQKGHIVRNWVTLLIFGLALISISLYIIITIIDQIIVTKDFSALLFWRSSKGFGMLVVIFLIAFGIYSLVMALRFAMILKLYIIGKEIKYISLERLEEREV